MKPLPLPLALVFGAALLVACSRGERPALAAGGGIPPCPDTPNCVSTEATDSVHAIAPLPYRGTAEEALARARAALLEEPRTRVVAEGPGYLHAEARSRIFRFVDDVQIVVDEAARLVRFRSASRVGRGDMGVNRARMERFRDRFLGGSVPG